MKTMKFWLVIFYITFVRFADQSQGDPIGGEALCGHREFFIYVPKSIIGPGFVPCDTYNEFIEQSDKGNIHNVMKLVTFRRKPKKLLNIAEK